MECFWENIQQEADNEEKNHAFRKAIAAGTQKNDDPQDVTSAGTVSKRGQSASTAVVTATVAATTIVASTSGSFLTAAAICSS